LTRENPTKNAGTQPLLVSPDRWHTRILIRLPRVQGQYRNGQVSKVLLNSEDINLELVRARLACNQKKYQGEQTVAIEWCTQTPSWRPDQHHLKWWWDPVQVSLGLPIDPEWTEEVHRIFHDQIRNI
jgi:hypothetical protein